MIQRQMTSSKNDYDQSIRQSTFNFRVLVHLLCCYSASRYKRRNTRFVYSQFDDDRAFSLAFCRRDRNEFMLSWEYRAWKLWCAFWWRRILVYSYACSTRQWAKSTTYTRENSLQRALIVWLWWRCRDEYKDECKDEYTRSRNAQANIAKMITRLGLDAAWLGLVGRVVCQQSRGGVPAQ